MRQSLSWLPVSWSLSMYILEIFMLSSLGKFHLERRYL